MNNCIIETWETGSLNLQELASTIYSSIENNSVVFLGFNPISNPLEQYIYDIITFHFKNRGEVFTPEKHYVELSIFNENNSGFEYDKINKKHPSFTIIVFLDECLPPFYFTSIDFESYKYKDIEDDNTILISKPKKNSHIIFDGSNYYGILSNSSSSGKYMKINIWNEKPSYHNYDNYHITSEANSRITSNSSLQLQKNYGIIYETIYDKDDLFDRVLYNDNDQKPFDKILSILNQTSDLVNTIMISIKKEFVTDLASLSIKYGPIAKDILPFFNNDVVFDDTNRFSRKKLINNTLVNYICYWIINESEKKTSWKPSLYKHYANTLSVEYIPPVLNFILFISNFWLTDIRNTYDIGNSVHLNIRDIFVSKYFNQEKDVVNTLLDDNDNSFFVINIQLSNQTDYIGGDVLFEDGDLISTNQGDMLIHSGKKKRTSGGVTYGEKYILVLIIDILM
jgi:hypothetical protein